MIKKTLIVFLFSQLALADSSMLVLIGYPNYEAHEKLARLSKAAAEKEKLNSTIAFGNGKLLKNIESQYPMETKEDVENAIKQASKNLKPGDSLTLILGNHGSQTVDDERPETAGLYLNYNKDVSSDPKKITAKELTALIKKYVPNNPVRISSSQCYSGGMHEISFELDNVCSITAVDHRMRSWVSDNRDIFGEGLPKEMAEKKYDFNKDNSTSLLEGYYHALTNDFSQNGGRGNLSSESYLNKYFKKHEYDYSPKKPFQYWYYRIFFFERREKNDTLPLIERLSEVENPYCKIPKQGQDNIDTLINLTNNIMNLAHNSPDINMLDNVPLALKKSIQHIIKKSKSSHLISQIEDLRKEYIELEKEWDNYGTIQKVKKWSDHTRKVREFRYKTFKLLSPLTAQYKLLNYAKKIQNFYASNPTEKQKKKFEKLMACENQGIK